MAEEYKPNPKTAEWLTWALEKAKALPYKPTPRWLFYRLVQEKGFAKSDYHTVFLPMTSKARKRFWNGWAPDTLADDTRIAANRYGLEYSTPEAWFESMRIRRPTLDFVAKQDNIVFVAFEAKAMSGQFGFYLNKYRVNLWPFGGDASVPYKHDFATSISMAAERWPNKPVVVLYFGDYDPKGLEIPENAMKDIRAWCDTEVEYVRVGLNKEHIAKYNIPDNPDAPGKYQWEAVPDGAAKELIERVFEWWSRDVIEDVKDQENRASKIWTEAVSDAIARAKKEL